jgi:hypothetical protein
MSIFDFLKKRKILNFYIAPTANSSVNLTPLQPTELIKASQLHYFRAIHTLLEGGANRLNWNVYRAGEKIDTLSTIIDSIAGNLFADWFVVGIAYMTKNYTYIPPHIAFYTDDNDLIKIENPTPPLKFARTLFYKVIEFERAQLQAYFLAGSKTLLAPEGDGVRTLIPTPSQIEEARNALNNSLKEAGVGGIEILPMRFEKVDIENVYDYSFKDHSMHLIREICNLFGIDSSLLNDPENKTYSNKTEAQKAFYVNLIIPMAAKFQLALNLSLINQGFQIQFDASNLEPLQEERSKKIQELLLLYDKGIISLDELKEKLDI